MTFTTIQDGQFISNGRRLSGFGFNKYQLKVNSMSQSAVQTFFDACKAQHIPVVRTWCFLELFRFLDYPLGTNLITNTSAETDTTGYTLGSGYTRTDEDSQDGDFSIKGVQGSGFEEFDIDSIPVERNTDYIYTFWRNIDNISSFAPVTFIKGIDTNTTLKDGGFSSDTDGQWLRKQIQFNSGENDTVQVRHINWGGNCVSFYDNFHLGVQSTPVLSPNDQALAHLDMILDEARKRGIKLQLVLADNPTYNTKLTYVTWANVTEGAGLSTSYPYVGFFDAEVCRDMYKDGFDILANHENTVNGRILKNDPTIHAWEAGNELRYDVFDSEGGTQNTINSTNIAKVLDWYEDVAEHMKTVDTNHLVTFGDIAHTWQWVEGDTVSNGSGYGSDYNIFAASIYNDFCQYHTYPTQGGDDTQLRKYGQRLGFPNEISGDGYRAQLEDFVAVAKANDKPCVIGEVGFSREVIRSNTYFPLHPRKDAFEEIARVLFDAGCDFIYPWNAETNDGGSFSVNITGTWDGNTTNLNYDDRPLVKMVNVINRIGTGAGPVPTHFTQ